jgi:protein O-mannosyl-transferase
MRTIFFILALCLPVSLLYGQFVDNPPVFDDFNFFNGLEHGQFEDKGYVYSLRWVAYATFEWTHGFFGKKVVWFRLGNLALHLATAVVLFLFLRKLFEQVLPSRYGNNETLSAHWLAFFGALIFALHPVSVYAVAYLIQRSMLMATLFALLTWWLFLNGLIRENCRYLLASVVTYFLAVFSKEHAIMIPAVTIVLLLLVDNQSILRRIKLVWSAFVLYGLVGVFLVIQVHSNYRLGGIYEPKAAKLMSLLGADFDVHLAYPLSMLTQSFLFFKYLWVWVVPSPAWMSIDMPQAFALRLWSWPQIAGLIGFVVYLIIAVRLLLKRGVKGLLGFALLCPGLLFATELVTVRIQEPFVLYRSYLWMAGAFAALPFLCQKLSAKQAIMTLTLVALLMMPLSWLRLTTFSHPLLLWDDAAQLVENTEEKYLNVDRIFYNRGTELMNVKHYAEALTDLTKAIELKGYHAGVAYFNRRFVYIQSRQYLLALNDSNKAIELTPEMPQFYVGKAHVLEKLKNSTGAWMAYKQACLRGYPAACQVTELSVTPRADDRMPFKFISTEQKGGLFSGVGGNGLLLQSYK